MFKKVFYIISIVTLILSSCSKDSEKKPESPLPTMPREYNNNNNNSTPTENSFSQTQSTPEDTFHLDTNTASEDDDDNSDYVEKPNIDPNEVQEIIENKASADHLKAYAALMKNGTVITWGARWTGGSPKASSYSVSEAGKKLENIDYVVATEGAFIAHTKDNGIISWGFDFCGGDFSKKVGSLKVKTIITTRGAVAAITENQKLIVAGNEAQGGDPNYSSEMTAPASENLNNVKIKEIAATTEAFAIITDTPDHRVITWGNREYGGDPTYHSNFVSAANDSLDDAETITATGDSFEITKYNGEKVTWGF